jgi:hypothetical protein
VVDSATAKARTTITTTGAAGGHDGDATMSHQPGGPTSVTR